MIDILYGDFRTGCGNSAKFAKFYLMGLKIGVFYMQYHKNALCMSQKCHKKYKKMECLHFTNGSNVLPAWKMTFDIIGNQYLMS